MKDTFFQEINECRHGQKIWWVWDKKIEKKKEKIFLVVKYVDDIGGWLDPDDSGPVGPWPCNQRKKKGSAFNPSKISERHLQRVYSLGQQIWVPSQGPNQGNKSPYSHYGKKKQKKKKTRQNNRERNKEGESPVWGFWGGAGSRGGGGKGREEEGKYKEK